MKLGISGFPWEHWLGMVLCVERMTSVFLTGNEQVAVGVLYVECLEYSVGVV